MPADNALNAFILDIEADLARDTLNFPTALEASRRIKTLAEDPATRIEAMALAIQAEPVLCARLIRMANAAALNPRGERIATVGEAVRRVGFAPIRCLAFAVAAEQMAQTPFHPVLLKLASRLWQHTVAAAAWARVLAGALRLGNPDTAMLASTLAHLGTFLLLARVEHHPALLHDPEALGHCARHLGKQVEARVLTAFEMPDELANALAADEAPTAASWPPADLGALVRTASALALPANPLPIASDALEWAEQVARWQTEQAALFEPLRTLQQELVQALSGP